MVARKLTGAFFIGCMVAASANAQTYIRQVDPTPDQLSDNVRGQIIRAGDVSPEEYARLLEEAEKIRAYQGTDRYQYSYPVENSVQTQSATVYDGRPNSAVTTGQGYQIELYDTPISPSANTVSAISDVTSGTISSVSTTYSAGYPAISTGHTVVKGDTLYSLSKRYGVGLSDLRSVNGIYGNNISIGQVLRLPGQVQQISQSTITQPVPTGRSTTLVRNVEPIPFSGIYAVLPGDTLYGIAQRACVSVDEIVVGNGLSNSSMISPGQRLTMPAGHCL